MFLGQNFNVDDLPQSDNNFEPIPAGWYTATIGGAELKDTKAGTGKFVSVRFDIIGPSHEGRVVFTNLNISNPNPKAEEIGRQQLGDIARALGLKSVSDSDQLIGGTLSIKVTVKDDPQYGKGNEVKGYKAVDGSAPPAAGASAPAASNASASSKSPPWAKS
jgi:hypothetical protein